MIIKPNRGLGLAIAVLCAFAAAASARAGTESKEAKAEASAAAYMADVDMEMVFGAKSPRAGQYLWRSGSFDGEPRVIISIPDQRAYLYRGEDLVAVAAIS